MRSETKPEKAKSKQSSAVGDRTPGRGLNRLPRAIIALTLSVLLWLYVSSTISPTIYPSENVELRNLGEGLTLVGQPPTVSIRVQDYNADSSQPVAYVDLTGIGPGTTWVPVQVQGVKNTQVLSVYPSQVKIDLEKVQSRKVPVDIEIPPSMSKTIGDLEPELSPSEVTISGSSEALSKVSTVVAILQPSAISDESNATVTVQAVDSQGNPVEGVNITPKTVEVTFHNPISPTIPPTSTSG